MSSRVVSVAGLLVGLIFIGNAPPVAAQNSRASILGQVTDPTAGAIAGAVVKVTRAETSETVETRTDTEGYYSFAFLNAGGYRLTVQAEGFKAHTVDHLNLETDETRDFPVILQVGAVQERVLVSAAREQIETTTATRVQRVDSKKLRDLPLIGRQAYSLVSLTPGVVFTQEQFGTSGFAGLRGWDANGRFIINGGKEGTNQFLMNGAPVSLTGRWQISPSVDAIQEFKVMTNTYDAQFGRSGGGTVVTTLKSGSNRWRGSVFEYLHNAVLDANSTQNNLFGLPRGKHITNQFGGVIGGPIRREKDFVFLSYEQFREIVPFPVVSDTVPMDLRSGTAFADYSIRIYDPLTAHECRPGVDVARCQSSYIRTQFPRNRIPASRISPIGRALLNLYPTPTVDDFSQNYLADGNTGRYKYTQPIVRWDHHQGERNRFNFVSALEQGRDIISENGFPAPVDVGRNANRLSQHYVAEWVHIASANTVADLRLSFGRFTEAFPDSSRAGALTSQDLGMLMPKPGNAIDDLAPRINLDLFNPIIGNSFTWGSTNHWVAQPSLIHSHGRHVVHWGAEFAYAAVGSFNTGRAHGDFSFTRGWTQQYVNRPDGISRNLGVRDGSGIADLLLGTPSTGFIDYNDSYYRTWPYYAFYVQDNWRVAPKLTLTLGVRYDVQIPVRERFNRVNAGWDFSTKNPLSDQVIARWKQIKREYDATNPLFPYPDAPAALYGGRLFASDENPRPHRTDWTNLQPRVGVAWNLAPRTVMRAGFGIFHRTATQFSQNAGFNQRTNYVNSIDGLIPAAGRGGPFSLENPFPRGIQSPTGSTLGLLTNVGRAANFDGSQRPIPRTFQYSFGFQRELPGKLVLDLTYAGSQTVKDAMPLQLNAVSWDDFNRGGDNAAYLNRRVPSPFYGILPADSDLGATLTVTGYNLLRPNPLFLGIAQTTNPWARYRYDSLQIAAERKFEDFAPGGIFTFLFSYTFSKSFEQAKRLNDWNLREAPVNQLTAFDKPHTVALSGLWELPFGWGRKFGAGVNRGPGALINGWSIDWILAYNAGYPVARPDAQFLCSSYNATGGQTHAEWFNNDPGCWTARPQYELRTGEDRFGSIRNPSAPQLHVSAEKTFWLSERFNLQLRGESFNLTNTPIFPAPNTNFRDPRFGQIPRQQNNFPRFVQLALRLSF